MDLMHKEFKRSLASLDEVFLFLAQFADENAFDKSTLHAINLAVEELFTNMVKYNHDNPNNIRVDVKLQDKTLTLALIDFEEEPFDITKNKVYDLNQSVSDRPIGKLGLHLVNEVMDKINYQHKNKKTIITMVKYLGDPDAKH